MDNSKSIIIIIKIIHKWKLFRRVANLPRTGRLIKFTPGSSYGVLSYYNKPPVSILCEHLPKPTCTEGAYGDNFECEVKVRRLLLVAEECGVGGRAVITVFSGCDALRAVGLSEQICLMSTCSCSRSAGDTALWNTDCIILEIEKKTCCFIF